MRVRFYTFGCKVNQYETQALSALFAGKGHAVVRDGPAELFVLNTCTVTGQSDHKAEKLLRRLRREYPDALIALTGCLPQGAPERAALMAEADIVTGSTNRAGLPEAVEEFLRTGRRVVRIVPHRSDEPFEDLRIDRFEGHTRAFVKIQEGCDRGCAYCIVPRTRGPLRSKSLESLIRELEALADSGYKEAVLVGINLALYGRGRGLRLTDAVDIACSVPGIRRVRLSSLEFDLVDRDDFGRMARQPKFCPHFHLPLQSGCDRTLARMGRRYTAADFHGAVAHIRQLFDNPALSADIIAGFPGEDEAEFAESLCFVQSLDLADAHVFPFSPRETTPAAQMDGQLSAAVKNERARSLTETVSESRKRFLKSQLGRAEPVLFQRGGGGFTPNYTPVTVPAPPPPGEIRRVLLTGLTEDGCVGSLLEPEDIDTQ